MARRSAADAELTVRRIIDEGVAVASTDGLGGLTIGPLAETLGMSKAGVVGPFGSKADLQAAVLDHAVQLFLAAVVAPTRDVAPGMPRLLAVLDRWTAYLADSPFPNGCFITAASCELDGRPGPLRDQLRALVVRWRAFLHDQITTAQAAGDIAADRDPADIITMLVGLAMVANQAIQLLDDPAAARHAHRLMLATLSCDDPPR